MRMLDLFSGIGGFSLAAKWVWGDDLDIVGFCEIDKHCRKVLEKNFPGIHIHGDIRELDGSQFKDIDLITGGFPCVDISTAGRGKGLIDEDTGEATRSGLWFELGRIISEVRPKFAVIENVPALTSRGGVRVIEDLAEQGYSAEWQIISAGGDKHPSVGAPHIRARIWIVTYPTDMAYPNSTGSESILREKIPRQEGEKIPDTKPRSRGRGRDPILAELKDETDVPDTNNNGSGSQGHNIDKQGETETQGSELKVSISWFESSRYSKALSYTNQVRSQRVELRTQSGIQDEKDEERGKAGLQGGIRTGRQTKPNMGSMADGVSLGLAGYWDQEPEGVPRTTKEKKNRVSNLKALGNSIVPQCAQVILQRIKNTGII